MQFIAKTKDAVSATCCYGRRQLSWQVAEAGQKNKIELQWDDITNLRVTPMVSTASSVSPKIIKRHLPLNPYCQHTIASDHIISGSFLWQFFRGCYCLLIAL